ncbi:MAG: hypothetical protein M3Q69_15730 [Acidobacteriota bacterium]|nr:hypothetical protein [Acidobacteriota bacterium]
MPARDDGDTIASLLHETATVLELVKDPEGDALDVARAVLAPRRMRICELLAHEGVGDAQQTADLLIGGLLSRWLWSSTERRPRG